MGNWCNLAFVQTDDLEALGGEVRHVIKGADRRLLGVPLPKNPAATRDSFQYCEAPLTAPRWGLAGFRGAPGWCVLLTAPYDLLVVGDQPLLAQLTQRLKTRGFQFNVYDDSPYLVESDERGRVARSGYGDADQYFDEDYPLGRLSNGEVPREEDPMEVRFQLIDPKPTAAQARKLWPGLSMKKLSSILNDVHPAEVILAMTVQGDEAWSGWEQSLAVPLVFGGNNEMHCDNGFTMNTLMEYGRCPVSPSFIVYADR